MPEMRQKIRNFWSSDVLYIAIASLVIAIITFLQLQTSVSRIPFLNARMSEVAFLWNSISYCLMLTILLGLFKKAHYVLLFWSVVGFGISLANYYVLLFHGAPLTLHLLKNISTAIDVIGSYRFSLDLYSGAILLGFCVCIMIVVFLFVKCSNHPVKKYSVKKRATIVSFALILLIANTYVGIFSDFAFKPKNSIDFSWSSSAGEYGFLALQLESHLQENTYTSTFDNYSEDTIHELYENISSSNAPDVIEEQPDIILILNECFYDLDQVTELETNISPLSNYYGLTQAVKGYAVASGIGGGTNRSEYELLTSISTTLLPNQTPFQALDVAGHCSIISYLEALGYETYGAHCAKSSNYNRKYSYSALGFDHSFFDVDFIGLEKYGNRDNTDASAYKNLINWYEQPSEKPKFMYLLTYQNHGGWEQNPEELDTVRVQNDFGEYTSQVNEYLSSLRLSDIELVNLLSYFENVNRPVIVCMVGDHGPSFIKNIYDQSMPEQDYTYLAKATPLLIWSNYGLESQDIGYVSMNYVVPKLIEIAELPLSPYYKYQIDLMADIPVIMSSDSFYDKEMRFSQSEENAILSKKIENYFSMCFNNLQENRFYPLFEPMK